MERDSEIVIEIPQYMEHIVLSKQRRAKYKKDSNGETVIANPRSVGTEKRWKINGQAIYSGMNPNMRAKVIKEMKKYLYPYLRPIREINNYPISLELTIYQTPGVFNKQGELVKSWDLGNQEFIWMKCFEDALCGNVDFDAIAIEGKKTKMHVPKRELYPAKITDDSVRFINRRICNYQEVATEDERKLVFKIIDNR